MLDPRIRIEASPYKNITEHSKVKILSIWPPVIFLTKVFWPFLISFHLAESANNVPEVYFETIRVWVPDLRQRIIEAVELITPHMLINTWQELEYRLDICQATAGAHIEVYGRA
jgi:hypothetical protein